MIACSRLRLSLAFQNPGKAAFPGRSIGPGLCTDSYRTVKSASSSNPESMILNALCMSMRIS